MSTNKQGTNHVSLEVFIFYNRSLIWILTGFCGLFFALAGKDYINKLSTAVPQTGLSDALAIYSFVIAAFLLMLIAEVIDNHYFRVFSYLCMLIGGAFSWMWMLHDAKKLEKISMSYAISNFQLGWIITLALCLIVVIRLIKDWHQYGRGRPQSFKDVRNALAAGGVIKEQIEFNKQKSIQELAAEVQSAYDKAASEQPIVPIVEDPVATAVERKDLFTTETKVKTPATKLIPLEPTNELKEITFSSNETELVIGRTEGSIKIPNDMQISRKHAMLAKIDNGIKIIDLGSTNGVIVNGKKVVDQPLFVGDTVQLGQTKFYCE